MAQITTIKPQKGFQENFARSTVSVAWGGGSLGGGKTFGLMLALAPYVDNPKSEMCLIRKTTGELKTGGGILEEIKKIYDYSNLTESRTPTVTFESGARVLLMQVANESRESFQERWKGSQFSFIGMDELTGYEFESFTYLLTRNRSDAGYKPLMRGTTNPKYNSWVRIWLQNAGYIGDDGYIKADMDGVVRYFYIKDGRDVRSVIWGATKEEVYLQYKDFFDDKVKKSRGKAEWGDFILDFVFYRGDIWGNEIMLDKNPNYIASVTSAGEMASAALLDGNWFIDPDMWDDLPISEADVAEMFTDNVEKTGEYAITADIALGGKDNFVAMAWRGLHCVDITVKPKCTAQEALSSIRRLQGLYNVPDSRVVFDGVAIGEFVGGAYGVISGALNFKGQKPAMGMLKYNYSNLDSQCADKLTTMIKNRNITLSSPVYRTIYQNAHMKYPKTISAIIFEEVRVLQFDTLNNGKKKLINSDKQKELLNGRSPDVIDNMKMLMYLYLDHTDDDLANVDEEIGYDAHASEEDIMDFLDAGAFW